MNNRIVEPELRFSEFKNNKEWVVYTLESLSDSIFDGVHQTPQYTTKGIPFYSVENIVSGVKNKFITEEDYKIYTQKNKPEKYDILITRIGTIGYSKVIDWDFQFSIYVTLAVIKSNKKFNSYYLNAFFQSSWYQKEILSKSLLNAIPCKINMNELKKTRVILPPNGLNDQLEEQQKIAECLNSIDELIAGEEDKLKELKNHKKGLLQRLFPKNNSSNPELRFPEFKNNWENKKFKKYIKLYRGSSPRPIQDYLTDGEGVNWIKIGDTKNCINYTISTTEEKITYEGAEKSRYVNSGELILANSMTYGKAYLLEISGCIYDGWFVLRDYEQYFDKKFLLYQLNSEILQQQYQKLSAGGIVLNISSDIVYQTNIFHTSIEEQNKIAECLNSIDELISAQTEKIEALKLHKKGLMQGLFPSLEEVKDES